MKGEKNAASEKNEKWKNESSLKKKVLCLA